jgi:ABC-type antimicrobial peptide transport system permease subunit
MAGGLARSVIVRTDGDPRAVMGSIRQAVHDVDPTVPLTELATVEDLVARALESPASLSLLVASVAAVALVLAVLGIYGVMAYQVEQRAREIGIRRALGGSSGHVLRLVTGQGMTVVLAGIAVGLPIAYLSSRSLSSLLFSVGAGDMTTYAAVTVFLTLVALAACVIPARRVLAMPPSAVLRSE